MIVRRLSGSQRFYEIQIFLRALRPGKPGRLRGTFCFEACYQVWISLKTFDMLEPNLRRFRIGANRGSAADFGQAGRVRGNDGTAERQRLQSRKPEAFGHRGKGEAQSTLI